MNLALIMNAIVVPVYWLVLHKYQMAEYNKPVEDYGKRLHQRLVHSIPASVCVANFILSQARLKKDFGKVIVFFAVAYGLFLFAFFEETGRVQYPFLDFRDAKKALFNLTVICLAALALYHLAYLGHESFIKKYLRSAEGGPDHKGRRRAESDSGKGGDVQLQELINDRESHSRKPLLLHEDDDDHSD